MRLILRPSRQKKKKKKEGLPKSLTHLSIVRLRDDVGFQSSEGHRQIRGSSQLFSCIKTAK